MKTIIEINEKLKHGEAVVLTAQEFKSAVRNGRQMSLQDIDVVTTATFGVMSGTAAILSIPVAERGRFKKAQEIAINDVPASPGPCPNESLGLVEALLHGTTPSRTNPQRYGGGHVFHDLVSGKAVRVEIVTSEGEALITSVTLADLEFARLVTTRACFKNYMAIINTQDDVVSTIFSVTGLRGPYQELTVSGCGELNPIENDPTLRTIGIGTKALVNGAVGYVTGKGTRSTPERPNLTLTADIKKMNPAFMGGFLTSQSPDSMVSVAIPIPVTTDEVLENLKILDEEIELPIVDIHDRLPIAKITYGEVWQGKSREVRFARSTCTSCPSDEQCPVETVCPSASFDHTKGIDVQRCYVCGACLSVCPHGAFRSTLTSVPVHGHTVPITLLQSCRLKAEMLASILKDLVIKRSFIIPDKVDDIRFE